MTDTDHDLIQELTGEIRVLRQVLDEIRAEMQWTNNNQQDCLERRPPPRRIISMSVDSADPEWASKVNQVDEAIATKLRTEIDPADNQDASQRNLFET